MIVFPIWRGPASVPPLTKPRYLRASGGTASVPPRYRLSQSLSIYMPLAVPPLTEPQYLHASGGTASVPPITKPQYLHASGGTASVPPLTEPQYSHASGGTASVPPLTEPQCLRRVLVLAGQVSTSVTPQSPTLLSAGVASSKHDVGSPDWWNGSRKGNMSPWTKAKIFGMI